jgi:hypothetical protein
MNRLRSQWNKCIDKVVFSKRSSTLRRKESLKLISIPNYSREAILNDYYMSCWNNYYQEMRIFLKQNRSLRYLCKKPIFSYVPTDYVMETMIKTLIVKKPKT